MTWASSSLSSKMQTIFSFVSTAFVKAMTLLGRSKSLVSLAHSSIESRKYMMASNVGGCLTPIIFNRLACVKLSGKRTRKSSVVIAVIPLTN